MGIMKTFLAIGIAIVLVLFVGYGVYVFYEPPRTYENSNCSYLFNCEENISKCYDPNKTFGPATQKCENDIFSAPEYKKCMNDRDVCEQNFFKTTARYTHGRNSFFILVAIGLASIIGGSFTRKYEGIGSGFVGGGVLVIVWSLIYTMEYWVTMSKYLKLVALGVVLSVLIYLGYKKLDRKDK